MADSIHIIGSKESGGAERFYARLIHSLAETRRVLAINKAGSSVAGLLDPGVEQFHLPLLNNHDLWSLYQIRRAALQRAPAVVQSYMGRATLLTRIPSGRGLVHLARLGGYYHLKAYRHAHHLLGNTKGICDYLIREGAPAERVHYIGNFVEPIPAPPAAELDALRESLGIPLDAFVIACAARFHENKGLPDLLDAFAELRERHAECRLILVGDGPLADALRGRIGALGIAPAVSLPGWRDPRPYYHLADVLACPSRHEPLGNTILEAWACAKPLVATRTQGAEELIRHEENGLLTPLRDPKALTQAFVRLKGDGALRAHLAAEGARTLRERFSKQTITSEYLHLYEGLLARPDRS